MKHKKCGTKIIEWKNNKGEDYHMFFVGYCPKCDHAVTKTACEDDEDIVMSDYYISKTCKKCTKYSPNLEGGPPDTCTYCKRFYQDLFEKKRTALE